MARLTNLSFELAGSKYELTIDFDAAALVQTIAFDSTAECTAGRLAEQKIDARVEIIPGQDAIIIYVMGEEVFRTDVFDHGSTPAEQFIQAMPAQMLGGDPILGCLVKASLSSIIGQTIDCCRNLEADSRWRIMSEYLHCMSTLRQDLQSCDVQSLPLHRNARRGITPPGPERGGLITEGQRLSAPSRANGRMATRLLGEACLIGRIGSGFRILVRYGG